MKVNDLEAKLKKITKIAFGLAISIPISIVLFVAMGFILALVIGIDEKNILLFIKCFMWLELVIYLINWVFCLRSFLWIGKFKKTVGTISTP
ncbi:hypothetical protein HB852_06485 [Listeria grandensis]|uniref:hypothetical protein n=1 Tax=Listeria grandensis TaxID=1494963 RepID=UPI0016279FB1|nr:hypothetical protein [Listeria grandensis]MBC1474258.1 hypothetical protein [Listeria grandensis]